MSRCVSYGQAFVSSQRRVLQIEKWEAQKCTGWKQWLFWRAVRNPV